MPAHYRGLEIVSQEWTLTTIGIWQIIILSSHYQQNSSR